MLQIRRDVFETNSSSTHSLTIMDSDDFEKWCKGELYLDCSYNKSYEPFFLTPEKLKELLLDDGVNIDDSKEVGMYLYDNEIFTYDTFMKYYENYDTFTSTFIDKQGKNKVAVSYYGYD